MYERILVPVDGSATSKRGLDEALAVAGKLGSRLRLVHVIDESSLAMSAGAFAGDIGDLFTLLREAGQDILTEAKRRADAAQRQHGGAAAAIGLGQPARVQHRRRGIGLSHAKGL